VPTHRRALAQLSTSELAYLARVKPETARKRLAAAGIEPARTDGRTLFFDARAALPALLGLGEGLNPTAERARLDKARADAQELRNAQLRGELVPGDELEATLISLWTAASQRLQATPAKVAPLAGGGNATVPQAEAIMREHVHRALHELADAAARADWAGSRSSLAGEPRRRPRSQAGAHPDRGCKS
jgi:phage terminase Nu1 subunit (DNA packaging protein)